MQKKLSKFSHALKKIPEGIVKLKWVFLVLFVALSIFGAVMIPRTKINYDLTGYLPANCDSSAALELLKKEFDDKGMAYVMVKDVTPEKADELKTRLEGVEGVATVTYVESMNYKNNAAMYTVSLKDYDSTTGAFDAVKGVIDALSDENAYLSGQSAFSYYTKLETERSILKLGIAIVVIILLVMLFTSKTYFELVVLILVFGAAMAINMGTNFVFNGISYISNLVALVLQLALSLDYSIILLHRYMEERDNGEDAKTATVTALTKGLPEILSSSLTTVAGLAALMLMTLSIGAEIGLSLAKGIVVSMATVIFFMPALLVIFDKPIQKTRHKSFVPNVTKPARAIVKARKVIVPLFLVIAILSGVGQGFNKYSFNYNSSTLIVEPKKVIEETGFGTLNSLVVVVPKGDAEKERQLVNYVNSFDLIDETQTTALSTINVYSFVDENATETLYLTDELSKAEILALIDKIPAEGNEGMIAAVKNLAESWFDEYVEKYMEEGTDKDTVKVRLIDVLDFAVREKLDTVSKTFGSNPEVKAYLDQVRQISFAKANLESENYSRITFNINGGVEDDDVFELIGTLKSGLSDFYEERYVTGESVVCYEMSEYFMKDNLMVCLFTDLFILLILLVTFKNISLPIILILAIQGGIFINFVIPFLSKTSISFIGYLIISAIQMGATIDYAIVLTNRYRSIRKDFANRYDAMATASNAVFPTIVTSGVILTATGFVMGALSSGVVAQLGLLLGIGTLTSILIVLFVLPSLLLVFEKVIDKTDFSTLFKRKKKVAVEEIAVSDDFTYDSNEIGTEQNSENKND